MVHAGRLGWVLAVLGLAAPVAGFGPGCASGASNTCAMTTDCAIGFCGSDGLCHDVCTDAQCPKGQSCGDNGVCQPNAGASTSMSAGPGTGGSTSSAGGEGGAASTSGASVGGASSSASSTSSASSASSASASATSSTGTSGGTATELDLCAGDGDCASPLLCRPLVVGGELRCTRACTSTSGCMTGTRCQAIGSETYCAGSDVGRACSVATTCNFGCLLSQQYCTAACVTASDCPNGYGCAGVGTPAVRVCVKAEAACGPGDTSACIAPAACDQSAHMLVAGCTLACASASDCPRRAAGLAAWTCASGICKRPADVVGPLETGFAPAQYVCDASGNTVNVCNDTLHLDVDNFTVPGPPAVTCGAPTTTDGFPGDTCIDSCRYQGGCPFGSACVGVGGVGANRVGLCLPTGDGEVGTSCSSAADCRWGDCTASGVCSRDCTADGVCPTGSTCTAGGGPTVEGAPFRRCL